MRARDAFTLVELSIVLAIIGLLIGGVFAGQALVTNARIRGVLSEYQSYNSAVNQFDTRFRALPGDMTNAQTYWGSDSGCPGTTSNNVPKTATCNGNGDRSIATYVSPYTDFTELYRAWQHLANAELITGKFPGTAGAASFQDSNIGINVPRSRIDNAGWSFYVLNNAHVLAAGWYFNNDYKNVLLFGKEYGDAGTITPAISGPQAKYIDGKIDDGKPGYGVVTTPLDGGPGFDCISTDVQSTAAYILTSDSIRCSLIFKVKVAKGGD